MGCTQAAKFFLKHLLAEIKSESNQSKSIKIGSESPNHLLVDNTVNRSTVELSGLVHKPGVPYLEANPLDLGQVSAFNGSSTLGERGLMHELVAV